MIIHLGKLKKDFHIPDQPLAVTDLHSDSTQLLLYTGASGQVLLPLRNIMQCLI